MKVASEQLVPFHGTIRTFEILMRIQMVSFCPHTYYIFVATRCCLCLWCIVGQNTGLDVEAGLGNIFGAQLLASVMDHRCASGANQLNWLKFNSQFRNFVEKVIQSNSCLSATKSKSFTIMSAGLEVRGQPVNVWPFNFGFHTVHRSREDENNSNIIQR